MPSTSFMTYAAPIKHGAQRQRVDLTPRIGEPEHAPVEHLVSGAVKVLRRHNVAHVGQGVLAEQHRAEHRALCGEVVRDGLVGHAAPLARSARRSAFFHRCAICRRSVRVNLTPRRTTARTLAAAHVHVGK
jgi:hypothetical protein